MAMGQPEILLSGTEILRVDVAHYYTHRLRGSKNHFSFTDRFPYAMHDGFETDYHHNNIITATGHS